MTMPNYIVNWDELRGLLKDFIVPLSYRSLAQLIGVTKGKGFRHYLEEPTNRVVMGSWKCDSVVALSSIELFKSSKTGRITIDVNGKEIFQDVTLKGKTLKTHWDTLYPLNVGDRLTITCESDSVDLMGSFVSNIEYIDVMDNLDDLIPKQEPIPEPSGDNSMLILEVVDIDTTRPVEGCAFDLEDLDGNRVGRIKSIDPNIFTIEVKEGEYVINQVAMPRGYEVYGKQEVYIKRGKHKEFIFLKKLEEA